MPEYLAPGVYVEETSFRAKPIEGVSTSTAAFVGVTRKGPAPVDPDTNDELRNLPELLTSVGDFERIYGGPAPLAFDGGAPVNHLAHAVRAFFDNGGARLYVARVFKAADPDAATAASAYLVGSEGAPTYARFVARFPGSAGNGAIDLFEQAAEATWTTLLRAPQGTLARLRTGAPGQAAARPAAVSGGFGPFRLEDGAVLRVAIDNGSGVSQTDIDFTGTAAEVRFTPTLDLSGPAFDDDSTRTLTLTVGTEAPQTIVLDQIAWTLEDLVDELNTRLRGVSVDDDAAEVVITSDVVGTGARLRLAENADLGVNAAADEAGGGNVADLGNVGIEDVARLAGDAGLPGLVSRHPSTGRLQIASTGTGAAASLLVDDAGAGSAHLALGFATAAPDRTASGVAGASIALVQKVGQEWRDSADQLVLGQPAPGQDLKVAPQNGAEILSLYATAVDADGQSRNYPDLAYSPANPRYIGAVMAAAPDRRIDQLEQLFAFDFGGDVDPFALRTALLAGQSSRSIALGGGSDGEEPVAGDYDDALAALQRLEDISIVAAPGSSSFGDAQAIAGKLVTHCEQRRAYRIAVLDTPPAQTPTEVRLFRSLFDSTYAAMYYPWVVVSNPLASVNDPRTSRELVLPPSGFVAGIYARNDVQRGVHKAPANEVVRGALRFETQVNFAQQESLNPLGINCLRALSGRGLRLWGARTATSDGEWKYVNVRRYFNYLGASIDRGTQWAVFEPNGEGLWANIRESVSDFLYAEWRNGALLGATPKHAYFVRCDRSTMTQSDLDNGRLICEVGIALVKPAEFVIFRIGQKTADARS